jgi:hypothetical protein
MPRDTTERGVFWRFGDIPAKLVHKLVEGVGRELSLRDHLKQPQLALNAAGVLALRGGRGPQHGITGLGCGAVVGVFVVWFRLFVCCLFVCFGGGGGVLLLFENKNGMFCKGRR